MIRVPLLDLKAQYAPLREEIRAAMDRVCDAQAFILGPEVEALEKEVGGFCGAAFAIGVSSGTDALLAAFRIGARVSWRELSEIAVRNGLPADVLADFAELVFA